MRKSCDTIERAGAHTPTFLSRLQELTTARLTSRFVENVLCKIWTQILSPKVKGSPLLKVSDSERECRRHGLRFTNRDEVILLLLLLLLVLLVLVVVRGSSSATSSY